MPNDHFVFMIFPCTFSSLLAHAASRRSVAAFTAYTGELGYDGPLYDRLLAMTDDMLGPSPMHIKYVYWTMHMPDSVCRNSATTDQYHGTHNAIYYVISIVYAGQLRF